jgi:aryl-alcohol dehydrogenase-like predicted oxidoreductase
MQNRPLGQSGIEASVIGFGAWAIGGWMWGGTDERQSGDAIRTALDEGITLIDTAAIYGFGRSEEIVGQAIAGRRDEVVLASKCGLRWDLEKGELYFYSDDQGMLTGEVAGARRVYKYLGPDSIRHELELSLRRLKTDRIDLYQTHWQEPTTAIEDSMAMLLKLKEEGKIRAIGACNVNLEHIEAYQRVGPLDAVQNRFSMLDRQDAKDILPFCAEHQIAYLAYSPMAMGLLSGKIGPERQFGRGDVRQGQPRFSAANREAVRSLLEELRPIADAHGLTFAQLAVAWAFHQPGLTHTLVGARTPQQAKENARTGDVRLSREELQAIGMAIEGHPEIV